MSFSGAIKWNLKMCQEKSERDSVVAQKRGFLSRLTPARSMETWVLFWARTGLRESKTSASSLKIRTARTCTPLDPRGLRQAASVTILGCRHCHARSLMISLFGKNEPEPTLLDRLKKSVSKTKAALSETVDTIFLGERKIDPSVLKDLETALLSADLGVKPTREILDAVREKMDRNALSDPAQLKREIKSHIIRILNAPVRPDVAARSGISASQNGTGPRALFIAGLNSPAQPPTIGQPSNQPPP